MNNRAFMMLLLASCAGEPDEPLAVPPEDVCEARFAEPEGWCGGDPSGSWEYVAACNRTLVEWFDGLCPEGSYAVHPLRVEGELTLTSTSIHGRRLLPGDAPVQIEIYETCRKILRVCPTLYNGMRATCDVDLETECRCRIDPPHATGSDQGKIVVEANEIAYDFDRDLRSRFCAEDRYLYLDSIQINTFPDRPYYYILTRTP